MSRTPTTNTGRAAAIAAVAFGALAALLAFVIFSVLEGPSSSPGPAPAPSARAQQLYVSPTGNDGGAGTEAAPLRTIQAALEKAQPGTVITLAPGEYREEPTTVRDGAPDAPITIKGPENGKDPSGRNQAVLFGTGRIFNIDHSYYTLEGFTIDGQERLDAAQLPADLAAIDTFKNSVRDRVEDSKLIYVGSSDTSSDITGVTIRNMFLTEAG